MGGAGGFVNPSVGTAILHTTGPVATSLQGGGVPQRSRVPVSLAPPFATSALRRVSWREHDCVVMGIKQKLAPVFLKGHVLEKVQALDKFN